MVSEQKSAHGANNQPLCCSTALSIDNEKDDENNFIHFKQQQTDENILTSANLMTNHLKNLLKNATSTSNSNLTAENNTGCSTSTAAAKSLENVNVLSPASSATEDTEVAVTASFTTFLFNHRLLRKHAPYLRSLAASRTAAITARDTNGRSAALERAYVHDVYEQCEEPTGTIHPKVLQFFNALEPGSIVCDVGCGNGKYLTQLNPSVITIGVDRCQRLSKEAKAKDGEVLVCDNLELPFLDNCFDAVLSLAVIHHFATSERRINALRELARILRIGGRVVITVWALEQKQRRFESQDVLIPWQSSKNRALSYSDEEDENEFMQPYIAYTEDSTNSSRSTGDGDSSSLSSSSPGESCYSFVRRALQKLAGRRQNWLLEPWNSKEIKNYTSIDYEDARDLPIELRRLEDFEEFSEPPLSAGLKSRSLSSILNPPPRQIVRSRSSVPALGATLILNDDKNTPTIKPTVSAVATNCSTPNANTNLSNLSNSSVSRRPKLIKQKQSLCDEDYTLPEQPFNMISNYNSADNSITNSLHTPTAAPEQQKSTTQSTMFLRKQSSLNEELMAGNRLREKECVRKRIQKQTSLNEAFLCRSALLSKRLQNMRQGFTSSIKSSTGSLERATKNGLNKIMQNIKLVQINNAAQKMQTNAATANSNQSNCQHHHHQHHHHQAQRINPNATLYGSHFVQMLQRQLSSSNSNKYTGGPVIYCNNVTCLSTACYCSTYQHGCTHCLHGEDKTRRHSHESGSDSSKDSSLQSDTSVESEDSFASVIYIPKSELQQQQQQQQQHQQQYKQQHQNSNSSSSNSSSSNGRNICCCGQTVLQQQHQQQQSLTNNTCCQINCTSKQLQHHHHHRLTSAPTSPLIMPCPPTPAHSPAAAQMSVTSPPQTVAAVTAAMALLTPSINNEKKPLLERKTRAPMTSCFSFDEEHLKQQRQNQQQEQLQKETVHAETLPKQMPENSKNVENEQAKTHIVEQQAKKTNEQILKITRQTIRDLPPIPKFRKQQSLQMLRSNFPIVRSSSASGAVPTTSIPKLLTLELFNPATDDLDSDSSEASSPDSVDSVISAHKSSTSDNEEHELVKQTQLEMNDKQSLELNINTSLPEDFVPKPDPPRQKNSQKPRTREQCIEFAQQLSDKLLKCEQNNSQSEFVTLDAVTNVSEYVEGQQSKTYKTELNDILTIREELRERRLMLANLSTQPSQQQSPTSSSTSSLSSQTRSSCEEDNERSYMLQLYENYKLTKFNNRRSRQYNLHSETAYLLQDDSEYSLRDDYDDIEHDVILEEDEEAVAEAEEAEQNLAKTNKETQPTIICNKLNEETEDTQKNNTKTAQQWSSESSDNSDSSNASIGSASQGGATTHHRYYHVFREGELDALINNHVSSLHIVSSYYERASWCVVAEKVQVWTI